MLFSGKLNRLRNFALGLVFVGIVVMYIGYAAFAGYLGSLFQHNIIVMAIFLVLGFLFIIGSSIMYMWIGMLSTKAVQVYCPSCGKVTKVVGLKDECMFCRQKLSLDPKDASNID
ncbi:YgzB family protein [Aneurinibacillus terranovensis]|uniref:YgzB family protein n=1 Tax=Aneurinibacillus terranovensis TaxID=278991 RepID=UPI0004814D7D|nr:YgzB family protein [Aneurinibacillus terranovensis]